MNQAAKKESERKVSEATAEKTPSKVRHIRFAKKESAVKSGQQVMAEYKEVFRKLAE